MVGKPNLPAGAEIRTDVFGAAMATPGLNALDQEREASMADEGGASGALMETQEEVEVIGLRFAFPPKKSFFAKTKVKFAFFGAGIVTGFVGIFYMTKRFQRVRSKLSERKHRLTHA